MPQLIKDDQIIEDRWRKLDSDIDLSTVSEGAWLIPLALWLEHRDTLTSLSQVSLGVTVTGTDDVAQLAEDVNQLTLIEVEFPAFMDGRGFSVGRLLRERYRFQGELRAGGHFIRDQLCYLRRCGFNAFRFGDDSVDLTECLTSLYDFTDGYQPSVDQPIPLFARRG